MILEQRSSCSCMQLPSIAVTVVITVELDIPLTNVSQMCGALYLMGQCIVTAPVPNSAIRLFADLTSTIILRQEIC